MAKGLRASSKKTNKTKLRERVFGPIESARLDRLSSKLIELASRPSARAEGDGSMEGVEKDREASKETLDRGKHASALDQDIVLEDAATSKGSKSQSKTGRVQKRGRRKAASSMVFPVRQKGKRLSSTAGRKRR